MPGSPEAHPCLLSRGSDTSPVSQRLHMVALRSVDGGHSRQVHSPDTWAVCLWGPLSLHGPGCTGIGGGGGGGPGGVRAAGVGGLVARGREIWLQS